MTTFDEEMGALRALATDAREAIARLDEGSLRSRHATGRR